MKYIEEMSRKGISYKKYNSEFGAKILGKFGWKDGEGLGKTKNGITEAIQIKRREENIGLGKKKKEIVWNDKWWEQSYDNILKDMKPLNNDKGGYNLRNSSRKNSEETYVKKRKISTNSSGKKERKDSMNSTHKKERKNSISSNNKNKSNNKKLRKGSKDNVNNNSLLKKKRKITFIDI